MTVSIDFKFNFSRSILPLMPVSGLGLQILRHLVLQIEEGLKRKMATRQLVDGRHGPAQIVYLFHQIAPPADEALACRRMADHAWMRALFLSRKFKEYAAVDLVAEKEGSPALRHRPRGRNRRANLCPSDRGHVSSPKKRASNPLKPSGVREPGKMHHSSRNPMLPGRYFG